jgi:hypothetical protein
MCVCWGGPGMLGQPMFASPAGAASTALGSSRPPLPDRTPSGRPLLGEGPHVLHLRGGHCLPFWTAMTLRERGYLAFYPDVFSHLARMNLHRDVADLNYYGGSEYSKIYVEPDSLVPDEPGSAEWVISRLVTRWHQDDETGVPGLRPAKTTEVAPGHHVVGGSDVEFVVGDSGRRLLLRLGLAPVAPAPYDHVCEYPPPRRAAT